MPEFKYIARDQKGQIKRGVLLAKSKESLAQLLKEQGLLLTFVEQLKSGHGEWGEKISGMFKKVAVLDKIMFTDHLRVMIGSGISISKALKILTKQTEKKYFKQVIADLADSIEKGQSFTDSLRKYPDIFPDIYVNMVRVGETGGKLEESLGYIVVQLRKDRDLMNRVVSALLYPAVVVGAMVMLGVLMVVYVLPKLVEVFRGLDVELPVTTQLLIKANDLIQGNIILLSLGIVVLVVAIVMISRTKGGKQASNYILLRMPVFGNIVKMLNLARFSRTLSILFKSDIPITKALEITSGVLGNIYYQRVVLAAMEKIRGGVNFSAALEVKTGVELFPPMVKQMILVGEETGNLDKILEDLARFYEAEVTRITKNLAAIIEPMLMIVLGAAVAVAAVSVIMPIYSMMNKM